MKSKQFWVKRYLWVAGIAFMLLMAAALLRGRAVELALTESFIWAPVSAAVFTGVRYYKASKGSPCALCGDAVKD
jgi:hypothetical protein